MTKRNRAQRPFRYEIVEHEGRGFGIVPVDAHDRPVQLHPLAMPLFRTRAESERVLADHLARETADEEG